MLVGVVISAYLAVLRFSGEAIGDRPLLLLGALLIVVGIQLLTFGLLGQMFVAMRRSAARSLRRRPGRARRGRRTASKSVDTTNFAKFQTRNPVVRRMIEGFFERSEEIVEPLGAESVLDAGCGEGETLARLGDVLGERVAAIDILDECVAYTKQRLPLVDASTASVYELPFDDRSSTWSSASR